MQKNYRQLIGFKHDFFYLLPVGHTTQWPILGSRIAKCLTPSHGFGTEITTRLRSLRAKRI